MEPFEKKAHMHTRQFNLLWNTIVATAVIAIKMLIVMMMLVMVILVMVMY
jgi:hypothetical protein